MIRRQYLNALACRSFAIVSALIAGLAALRLYSQYLAPGVFGLILVGLQILSYMAVVDGGVRTALNRAVLAAKEGGERGSLLTFGQAFYSYLSLCAVPVGIVLMLAYSFTDNAGSGGLSKEFYVCLGIAGSLSFVSSAQAGLLVGLQAQSHLFLISGVGTWINILVLWLALRSGFGPWAFPLSMFAVFLITWPAALILIRQREPTLRLFKFHLDGQFWEKFAFIKSDAWTCFQTQISTAMLYSLDLVLVGLLCSPAEAAVYGVLSRIFGIIRNVLQSTGEVAWPMIAEKGLNDAGFANPLLRLNAWVYGGVFGAVLVTILPFCRWYMGPEWTAPGVILYLALSRYLLTGLIAPISYFLFGLGRFDTVTRSVQRELIVGGVLAFGLGWFYGMQGIAAGFLLGTPFGTFIPLILAYAEIVGKSILKIATQVLWRAFAGLALSAFAAALTLYWLPGNWQTLLSGAVGVCTGLAGGLTISLLRRRKQMEPVLKRNGWLMLLKQM